MKRVAATAIVALLCMIYSELHAQEARINLGPNINGQYSELQPIITSDGMVLFFTRKGDPQNIGYAQKQDDEDIWYSVRNPDMTWGPAIHLDGALNTAQYNGVRAVNGTFTNLYLQNQFYPDGTYKKGFSVSERNPDGSWGFPVPLKIENYYNDTTIASVAVSQDENVLILSLKRKDSKGGHDLYVSFKTAPYTYSEPLLIEELSTEGDEVAPFVGFDDYTMYFPTTGWGAENGLHDIFVTYRLDSTWQHWSKPERLPFPINTASADFYFNLTAQSDTVYLSSWHETSTRGFGRSDIWKCGMPEQYRPATFMRFPTTKIDTPATPVTPIPTATPAPPPPTPAIGSLLRLENVYFDSDKATLRPESVEPLDKLVALMNQYPTMRIEIQGHTDSDGGEEHNMQLSGGRSRTVMQYLIDHGVAAARLEAKGYGELQPIAPNMSAAGKQLNRRVMVLIKGFDYHG